MWMWMWMRGRSSRNLFSLNLMILLCLWYLCVRVGFWNIHAVQETLIERRWWKRWHHDCAWMIEWVIMRRWLGADERVSRMLQQKEGRITFFGLVVPFLVLLWLVTCENRSFRFGLIEEDKKEYMTLGVVSREVYIRKRSCWLLRSVWFLVIVWEL